MTAAFPALMVLAIDPLARPSTRASAALPAIGPGRASYRGSAGASH